MTLPLSEIRRAIGRDRDMIARMMVSLWPNASNEEQLSEVDAILATGLSGTLPAAILVADNGQGELLGFLQAGLRSHADGCDPARPVGFVESWFVVPESRRRGVGTELMRSAQAWARGLGCTEMASDTWIDSEDSQQVHQALGFEVVDRCVHFRKRL